MKAHSFDNVYRKLPNGRYQPFGVYGDFDYLPDGLWYIRHSEYSKATTSVSYLAELFKVGDSKYIDIQELAGMQDLVEKVTHSSEYMEATNREKGFCAQDIVSVTVKVLTDIAKEQKEKNKKHSTKCYDCKKEFDYSDKDIVDGVWVICPDCGNRICILDD